MRSDEFALLEQQLGYKYAPHGLLASDMAEVADLPRSIFMDWMHSLCSSGGVAQYEVNQFVRRVVGLVNNEERSNMFAQLDNFRLAVVWPKREPRFKTLKLEERIVNKPGSHARMFAAECLQVVMAMGLYSVVLLQPRGKLPREIECFLILGRILNILRSGYRAVARVRLLEQLVLQHHDLFMQLYPECAKIKPHLLFHIVECIYIFQANISCFCTERKHKSSKRIATFAFNNWCLTMMRRDLGGLLAHATTPQAFQAYWLENPKQVVLPRNFEEAAAGVQLELALHNLQLEGKALHTPVGVIHPNDFVAFTRTDGSVAVGFAKKLLQHPGGTYWCLLHVPQSLGGAAFHKVNGQYCLIPASAVRGTFPYFIAQDRIYLVAPVDLL